MSWVYLGLQVTAGVCAGYTVALVYKTLRAEIQAFKQREKNHQLLSEFMEQTLEEVKE